MFVTFEGGDGAGKSTQASLLGAALAQRGIVVVVTREPGATELGVELRRLLLHGGGIDLRTEALLFAADRAEHVARVIRPALERGEVVVCDRFTDSSLAYQCAGRGLDHVDVANLSAFASGGLVPDLTIVLDVDPETSAGRLSARDRMESAGAAFHARVRRSFLDAAAAEPQRYLVLDAAANIADLHDRITKEVVRAYRR